MNAARQALINAVNRAMSEGAPAYVEIPFEGAPAYVEIPFAEVEQRVLSGHVIDPDVLRMKRAMLGACYVPTRNELAWSLDHRMVWVRMAGGNYWQARRNGATKLWKREPDRFRMPWKVGLGKRGQCGAFTQDDLGPSQWHPIGSFLISETDPNPKRKR
jgi:hypothetical protein